MGSLDINFEVNAMKEAIKSCMIILTGMTFAALLVGCATPTSEADFGNSVRQMIEAQKYIPPGQRVNRLPLLDGQKAEASIRKYRKDAATPVRIQTGTDYGPAIMTKQ